MDASVLVDRWQGVLADMAEAARKAGRPPEEIRLLAVSKFHSAEAIGALYAAGQRLFGENYVQEALAKMDALPRDVEWHFIGHLQTNKVRFVAGTCALLHGLDSLKLAQALQKKTEELGVVQDVLVQVNLARESQKSGILEQDLPALAGFLVDSRTVRWRGLMLIPPVFDEPEKARPYFAALRSLRDALERRYGLELPELSMGMTGDFIAAIQEGATLVRVGTRIFGARA